MANCAICRCRVHRGPANFTTTSGVLCRKCAGSVMRCRARPNPVYERELAMDKRRFKELLALRGTR